MPRDAAETERLALAACEQLAESERRMPTVKMVMDTIGIRSPEVVGRALRRWREAFLERTLAQDVGLGLPTALVQPLRELIALARAQAQREIEQVRAALAEVAAAKDLEVAAAHEATIRAERETEAARHELAVFRASADEQARALRADAADLRRRLEASGEALNVAQRALASERESGARCATRLEQANEHHAAEKLALVSQYEDRLEGARAAFDAERGQLVGQIVRRGDEVKRLQDGMAIEGAKSVQAREALANLKGVHEALSKAHEALRHDLVEAQAGRNRAEETAAEARAIASLLQSRVAETAEVLAALRVEHDRCTKDLARLRVDCARAKRPKAHRADPSV